MAGAFQWPGDGDPRDFSVELEAAFAGTPLDALTAACRDADLVGGSLEPAERLAAALGLDAPLEDTDGAVSPADRIPSDDDWVRIATDLDPAIGAAAPDVVLGRWADGADRASLRAAVVWGALYPGDGWDVSPADRWMRARGPLRVRLGARVVARTPPAPWAIDRVDGDRVWVRDRIGLGPWVPDGPVTVPALAAPAGRGDGLLARIVPTDAGWVAVGAIALPTVPAAVPRWVRLRALWLRATGTAVRTTADVLRHAGHHVARRALECAR